MKILSINKFFFLFGGSDRYFFEVNALLEKGGHQVIPFSMEHPRNHPSHYERYFVSMVDFWNPDGLRGQLRAAGRVLYSSEARRKIRQLIDDTKPDIAHVHSIYHQISPSILLELRDRNIPILETLHDYKPICPTYRLVSGDEICERCQGKKFYQAVLQRCNNGSVGASGLNSLEMYLHHGLGWYDIPNLYHSPSLFLQEKMIQFGMPSGKFVHIPLFIDPDKYIPLDREEPYILYFGRLSPVKGVKTLLSAMAMRNNKKIRLLIVGEGPQHEELLHIKQSLGLDQVEFLGYREKDVLWKLVGESLFTILPSEWYENQPLAVLEAMAMAKPVIGSDIGGIPELIDHGATGLIFPPGDAMELATAIEKLVNDPPLRRQMGQQARAKVITTHNASQHLDRILEAYDHCRAASQ